MKYLVKIMFDALVHEDLSNVAIQVYSKDFDEWLDSYDSFMYGTWHGKLRHAVYFSKVAVRQYADVHAAMHRLSARHFSFLGAFFWSDFRLWHTSCTVHLSVKLTSPNCSSSSRHLFTHGTLFSLFASQMAWQYLAVVQPSSFRAIDRAFQYSRMEKIAMKWMEERLKGATSLVKNLPSKVEGLLSEKTFR